MDQAFFMEVTMSENGRGSSDALGGSNEENFERLLVNNIPAFTGGKIARFAAHP
jgi:hypothetical protein